MRQQQLILRKIAEQNLNPKVPYVAGKNGVLVPKRLQEAKEEKAEEVTKHVEVETAPLMGALTEDNLKEQASEVSDEKPKKKLPPPPKKKKSTDE